MLARAGTAERQPAFHDAPVHVPGALQPLRVGRVIQDHLVEIAVADMADDAGRMAERLRFLLRADECFRQARDRHADIGGQRLPAGLAGDTRPVAVMPRLPQLRPLRRIGRPLETTRAMAGGDRLHHLGLFLHAGGAAVEFQEQRGLRRIALELRIGDGGGHHVVVQQLDPRDGDAHLHHLDHRLHRALQRVELHHGDGGCFRDAMQAQPHPGDDAERAFAADKQPRQVVAIRGFSRAAAGFDHAAIGEHDLKAQHILPDRAVADGIGAGGAGGDHAAERAMAARVHGEEHALVAQMLIQLLAGHAGFDQAVHILGVDLQDAGHAREIEADPLPYRVHMPFEGGARAERHHRHVMAVAEGEKLRDLLRRLHEGDGVGQGGGGAVLAAAVLLAHRRVGGQALPEQAARSGDDRIHRAGADRVHARLLTWPIELRCFGAHVTGVRVAGLVAAACH